MSIPSIPGYLGQDPTEGTLASVWRKPDTDLPIPLWPAEILQMVRRDPVDWVTIEQYAHTQSEQIGFGCVLVDPKDASKALSGTSWIGRGLGAFSVFDENEHETGLALIDGGARVEFFVHARKPSGARERQVEVSHPFLWYWDAYRVKNGWRYVDGTGKEHDLVRFHSTGNAYKVEVRALEFRQFLHACKRSALIQIDYVPMHQVNKFESVNSTMKSDWVHLDFHARYERLLSEDRAFSRLVGQYIISGIRTSRLPKFEEFGKDAVEYPEFIYAIEPATGHPLTHTCDPDALGTYFDKDNRRLHYLTPVYFRKEVLQPYSAEPNKYTLSATRLSCLDLWSINLAFNERASRGLPRRPWSRSTCGRVGTLAHI
ncbi:hypothetical protein ACFHW1_11985 [Micromonospora sp. LOL_014]|uniref:hypothetical protein n=1 Tax=Micromonospora sp. LOL_014 TaxID=3345415 RepID=UPI003A8705A6